MPPNTRTSRRAARKEDDKGASIKANTDNNSKRNSSSNSDLSPNSKPSPIPISPTNDSNNEPSFHPSKITPSTFRNLLARYETTAEQVHRRKLMRKIQPKEKGTKRKAGANVKGAVPFTKTTFSPSEQGFIDEETDKFLVLDRWRYEGLPALVGSRRLKGKRDEDEDEDEDEDAVVISRDELVRIMEWKTTHGRPRPPLLGMIKSNQTSTVKKSTSSALKNLPTADPKQAPEQAFPQQSMEALNVLRGVGPATSSLILSIMTADGAQESQQVPFYSDDLFLWVCAEVYPSVTVTAEVIGIIADGGTGGVCDARCKKGAEGIVKPNGELDVRYSIQEYRRLWGVCQEVRRRLQVDADADADAGAGGGDGKKISMVDLEKVAYVLRHIAVSGFYGVDSQEILRMTAEEREVVSAGLVDRGAVGEEKKVKRVKNA